MYQCLHSSGNFLYRCCIILMLCWGIGFWGEEAKGQQNPCPGSQTVNIKSDGCDTVVTGINLRRGFTAISYELSGATETSAPVSGTASGQSFNVGTTTVTYTYENRWGQQGTCNFDVRVLPNIIMPDDLEVDNDEDECYYTVDGKEFDPVYGCDPMPVGFTMTNDFNFDDTLDGEQLPVGKRTIIWSFLLNGQEYHTETFTVTVKDKTPPKAVCQNITVTLDKDLGTVDINGSQINNGSSDNCPLPDDPFSLDKDIFNCTNLGENPVTLTVRDKAGNFATCTSRVTVQYHRDLQPQANFVHTEICSDKDAELQLTNPGFELATGWKWTVDVSSGITPDNGLDDETTQNGNYTITQSFLNTTDAATQVNYHIVPMMYSQKCELYVIPPKSVIVNPHPKLFAIKDTSICNNDFIVIYALSETKVSSEASIYYDWTVLPNTFITGQSAGSNPLNLPIDQELHNMTSKFRDLTYTLTPKLYLNETFCSTTNDITTTVTVEPTPVIQVSVQDTIVCNDSKVHFEIDSLDNHPFGKWQYWLDTESPSNDFATPEVSQTGDDSFTQTFRHNATRYQSMKYNFSPRIITQQGKICKAPDDTTFVIHVNPTPLMELMSYTDSICHKDSGPEIQIVSDNGEVLGDLKYKLWKVEYANNPSDDVVANVASPVIKDITASLDQTSLWNKSVDVQTVAYYFHPLIEHRDFKCYGDSLDPKMIHIAPELKYDTIVHKYKGDYNISCNGFSDGSISIPVESVSGGWSVNEYSYQWKKDTDEQWKNISDGIISGLSAGNYEITVRDSLSKCETKKTIPLRPPKPLTIDVTPEDPTCQGPTGAIYLIPSGGVGPYKYTWFAEDLWEYPDVDFSYMEGLKTGVYIITVLDENQCEALVEQRLNYHGASHYITIRWDEDEYGPDDSNKLYNISCYGANDGRVTPNPGKIASAYKLTLNDEIIAGDTVRQNQPWIQYNTSRDFRIPDLMANVYYDLTIADTIGCEFISSNKLFLTEPEPITFDSLVSRYKNDYRVQCYGDENGWIEISNVKGAYGGEYKYEWSVLDDDMSRILPEESEQNLLLGAGIYQLVISNPYRTSRNGFWETGYCRDTSTYVLNQPPELEINADTLHIQCFGDHSGSIKLDVSGGGEGAYSFSWTMKDNPDFNSQNDKLDQLPVGTYRVKIGYSNGLCFVTDSFTLISPEQLRNDTTILSYFKCYGDNNASLMVNTEGGVPDYFYKWRPPDGITLNFPESNIQSNLAPGIYELWVTDSNGCEQKEIYDLESPEQLILTLNVENMSCNIENTGYEDDGAIVVTAEGGTKEYNYLWSSGQTTPEIEDLKIGIYTVTVTDANGCTSKDSAEIRIPKPLKVTATAETDFNQYHIDCYGNSTGKISLNIENGRNGYNYEWRSEDVIEGFDTLRVKAGSYTVTVIDGFNCKGTTSITLTQPDSLRGEFTKTAIVCPGGDTGSLTAYIQGGVMPYSYQWSDYNEDISFRDRLTAGIYGLRVVDGNGCAFDTLLRLSQPKDFMAEIRTIPAFCPETKDGEIFATILGGTPPYNYQWINRNSVISSYVSNADGTTNQGVNGLLSDVYFLEITDAANCSFSQTVNLDYTSDECLRIPNAFSPNGDGFNDKWEVFVGDAGSFVRYHLGDIFPDAVVEVWSTNWGMLLFRSQKGYPEPWDGKYNGKHLPVNSYQYIIRLNNTIKPVTGNVTIIR